jgi:hypothetical protein
VKRNFLIASVVGLGIVPGVLMAVWLHAEMSFPSALVAYTLVVWAGAGYVLGLIMWPFFEGLKAPLPGDEGWERIRRRGQE